MDIFFQDKLDLVKRKNNNEVRIFLMTTNTLQTKRMYKNSCISRREIIMRSVKMPLFMPKQNKFSK